MEAKILTNLFSNYKVLFIPVVNIDGFYTICQQYRESGKLEYIRKNMHPDQSRTCSSSIEDVGVDLNRNYDWAFGIDNIGSNGNPCAEDYRG